MSRDGVTTRLALAADLGINAGLLPFTELSPEPTSADRVTQVGEHSTRIVHS
jgi:hypothetical protein